ncbi:class I SAM-dependent methyltransferase [Cytobacillus suaedae]|nr:class I SAM-dependent methyltransferase [Cytobacillus suaedae]
MSYSQIKTNLKEAYNSKASERDSLEIEQWKVDIRESFLNRLLENNKQTLLEIGAGAGRDSMYFQDQGLSVICTDLSTEMINLCRVKGLEAQEMGFDSLTFLDESFDAVWALNCLLHVPKKELEDILAGIKRVLKTDGYFYMGVYGGRSSEGIWEDDFYEPKRFFSFYTNEELIAILKKYFTVISFIELGPETIGGTDLSFQSFVLKKTQS